MMSVSLCERCGELNGLHGKLLGGRYAWMCDACGAAWARHGRTLPVWHEHLQCLAQEHLLNGRVLGKTPPTYHEWVDWEMWHDRIQRGLFEMADKWLGEKVGKASETHSDDGASDER